MLERLCIGNPVVRSWSADVSAITAPYLAEAVRTPVLSLLSARWYHITAEIKLCRLEPHRSA